MSEPLVTALCLTRNRREWLPKAIACFLAQSYENREMLIVADGEAVSDLIPADPRVRLIVLDSNLGIGDKRNVGCDAARGEIICHTDDDDHSAPGRIAGQVARLQASNKAVTGYSSMKFTDGEQWWQYRASGGGFALGTSLCYRRDWWQSHPFPQMNVGEDSAFVAAAAKERQLVAEPDLDMMYATVHDKNTSKRIITGGCWLALPGYQWKETAA